MTPSDFAYLKQSPVSPIRIMANKKFRTNDSMSFNNRSGMHCSYQIYKTCQIKGDTMNELFPDQISGLIPETIVLLPETYIFNCSKNN
jgi:hypothetical protein